MRRRAIALVAVGMALPVAATELEPRLPSHLVGLLTPASVANADRHCALPDPERRHALFVLPSPDAAQAGALQFRAAVPSTDACDPALPMIQDAEGALQPLRPVLESSYEEVAVAAVERRGSWYRIALPGGSAWLDGEAADLRFDPYPQLLIERLSYSLPDWDGQLCASPGQDCRSLPHQDEKPLTVLDTKQFRGETWMQVEFGNEPCQDAAPVVLQSGWIRAHDVKGRVSAWFHSRGC